MVYHEGQRKRVGVVMSKPEDAALEDDQGGTPAWVGQITPGPTQGQLAAPAAG